MAKPGAAYYSGGVRLVVDGVPLRVARKSKLTATGEFKAWYPDDMKAKAREREDFRNNQERANARAKEAREAIEKYANALGRSIPATKKLIDLHRLHVLDNPPREDIWEYDL